MSPNRDADGADHGESASEAMSDPESTDENDPVTAEAATATVGPAAVPATEGDPPGIEALDERLPALTVDSRWWYWIAAVPVYFVLSTLVGVGAFLLALTGIALDGGLGMFVLFAVAFALIALPGVVLSVLFPLATYADARAVAGADVEWTPDPVLYGLLALAAVLVTAFTLSVPLALYYLYQRHRHVGVP